MSNNTRSQSNDFLERLKNFDRHSAIGDEFRVRTKNGAVLSILTVLSILYLTYLEGKFNLFTVVVSDRVHVNATTPAGLPVDFEVYFPNLPCALISVDATDPAGQLQSLHLDRTHHIWKDRMKDGIIIRQTKHELGGVMNEESLVKRVAEVLEEANSDCGSCYGAESFDGECCNTCEDVKRAYKQKAWHLNLEGVRQCADEAKADEELDEGCRIYGEIALSTGGGNLHFAPGHQLELFGSDTQLTTETLSHMLYEEFDVSHTIKRLHFGEKGKVFPNQKHQLDGETRYVDDGYAMYQYYIQVIPTQYTFLNGTKVETFQFSVTEHLRHVSPGQGRGLPGIFMFYEVSALHVEFEEKRKGWIRFFTSLCAVVGGVFTLAGVFDRMLWSMEKGKRQMSLG